MAGDVTLTMNVRAARSVRDHLRLDGLRERGLGGNYLIGLVKTLDKRIAAAEATRVEVTVLKETPNGADDD